MKRYLIAAAAAVLITSQADAQMIIRTGGFSTPGLHTPFQGITSTSNYYGGFRTPLYNNNYYRPNYLPTWSNYVPRYSTGFNNAYRPLGVRYNRGWRRW